MTDNTEALPPTGGPLFSKRKAIADRLGIVMTAEFNAIVREAYGLGMQYASAALAQRQQMPEGWQLVPVEPTDAMVDATHHGQPVADIYRDMLAAAPALTAAPSAQAEPINGEPQRAESESLGGPTARVESRACPVTPREEGCATPRAPHPTAQAEPQEPLTAEGIDIAFAEADARELTASERESIARAIERAHGIGKQDGK